MNGTIEVKNLSFSYRKSASVVLQNISCDLEEGHCIAILGNNGAGKSTLLKSLNRILKINSGSILVNGTDIDTIGRRRLAQQMALVPQHCEANQTMVFDAVLLGRRPYIQWDATKRDVDVVHQVLERLALTEYATRSLCELSGGELQKVMLARALAQEPQYLLLDEPTSNLDPKNQHEMLRIVRQICQEREISVVIVIHDLNLAVRYCDRFLLLRDASIYSYGGTECLNEDSIRDVYGLDADILEHKGHKVIVPR